MKILTNALLCGLLIAAPLSPALADGLFNVTLTLDDGSTTSRSYSSITDATNALKSQQIQSLLPSYTDQSGATANISIRGLPIIATYAPNSPTLTIMVPSLNITQTFSGSTRTDSQNQLKDWFKGQGSGTVAQVLTQILNESARVSPVDPVAGNPISLMSDMVARDFAIGTADSFQSNAGTLANYKNISGLGIQVGQFKTNGYTTTEYSLPLDYTYNITGTPYSLIFDMPLNYLSTEGATTYNASLGLGLRIPITPHWSITPVLRGGMTGSVDLGSAGAIYSGSLTSSYTTTIGEDNKYHLTVGDSVGSYKTEPVHFGDYSIAYSLSDVAFRNGVSVSAPANFYFNGDQMDWKFFVTDTRFTGSSLYVEHYNEIGFGITTEKPAGRPLWSSIETDASYRFGPSFSGFELEAYLHL